MKKTLLDPLARFFQRTWVQHLLFWIALVALFTLFRTFRAESLELSWRTLLLEIIPLTGVAAAVYFNLKLLLPRYLSTKRYLSYIGLLLGVTFINAGLVFMIFKLVLPMINDPAPGPHPNHWLFIPAFMTMQILFTIITSFLHFIRENSRLNEIALTVTEIESNRLRAELNSLKAQINPHFLFNTLNNIYSYSLFKSERTPNMILKLSELMNYIIYECQADLVSLDKEIAFIRNYVDLEYLRVEESVDIRLEISELVQGWQIAPLLFVPFLENAFKHGANISGQQPMIRFSLDVDAEGRLNFESENLLDKVEQDESLEKHGGIGLENVKKRLQLLYPRRHELKTTSEGGRFLVNLSLKLTE